jgi:hypothetical protein
VAKRGKRRDRFWRRTRLQPTPHSDARQRASRVAQRASAGDADRREPRARRSWFASVQLACRHIACVREPRAFAEGADGDFFQVAASTARFVGGLVNAIGKRRWAIAEGYIPPDATAKPRALVSHEAACILNAGDADAHVRITLYFSDEEPSGPHLVTVPARRTLHLRLNELGNPPAVTAGVDYSTVLESDVPIVVQHTRLDSRQGELALLSTVAFSSD